MLKPVSILALDDRSAALAEAVQARVSELYRLEDLVQWRRVTSDVDDAINAIHAQRQRPESPLRLRDDVSARELVLVIVDSTGSARTTLIKTLWHVRHIYEMRRLAPFFAVDLLCLLPEVVGATHAEDYAAAYGLMKALSDATPKPFDEAWLFDATNGSRVKFPPLNAALEAHAGAIAGMLVYEPEMSGALPGSNPRGKAPVFSAVGFAELVFSREVALQRVETRFAAEILSGVLARKVAGDGQPSALSAKQFVVGSDFALPLSRIGIDAGESLFHRFQPKARVSERTKSAEEVIAACHAELTLHRESVQLENLAKVARQGDEIADGAVTLLTRVVDDMLDRVDYSSATRFLDALLDPLADIRGEVDVAPRNLVTEIQSATAALDARLHFSPNTGTSGAARKRVRELASLLRDQRLVAVTIASTGADEHIAEWETERDRLVQELPDIIFREEAENNAARAAAREAEAGRLKGETESGEQQLRELFAQLPRAEQALREAIEERRLWLWRTVAWGVAGLTAIYAVPFLFGALRDNLSRLNWTAGIGVSLYAMWSVIRYAMNVAPPVRDGREALERLRQHILVSDKAKNAAYNDELQFEYDVAHRRATTGILRRTHEAAKQMADGLRQRVEAIEELAAGLKPPSIAVTGLEVAVVDDTDIDAWYDHTAQDRAILIRDLPVSRSESFHCTLDDLRSRVLSYTAGAFNGIRQMTLAGAALTLTPEAKLTQQLKRFAEISAPRIEVRDDDLLAQQTMQRDATLWMNSADTAWVRRVQYRFPEAQLKISDDAVRIHAITRTLHFPAFVIGQIDYYRAQYEAAGDREFKDVPDLLPMELALAAPVRAAYDQVVLGRAVGIIEIAADGQLAGAGIALGDSCLAAAQRLAAADAASLRTTLAEALAPRLSTAAEVARDLRNFQGHRSLSAGDRVVLDGLLRHYASLF
ncbi:MAG TPA: hypothetical protein VGJ81_22595 [Thermoanaerobaculia bacterium]|jgi:hypothetical protein